MKTISENRPSPIEFTELIETVFNWNIREENGMYTYNTLVCPGEPTRYNIVYALTLQHYTDDEIAGFENGSNQDNIEGLNEYKAVRDNYDAIVSMELGDDFEEYSEPRQPCHTIS